MRVSNRGSGAAFEKCENDLLPFLPFLAVSNQKLEPTFASLCLTLREFSSGLGDPTRSVLSFLISLFSHTLNRTLPASVARSNLPVSLNKQPHTSGPPSRALFLLLLQPHFSHPSSPMMPSPQMDSPNSSPSIPPAYLDPSTYLESPKFHLTHTFHSSISQAPLSISYALVGSQNPSHPVLVWLNGMGHHRLASSLFDGICSSFNVRFLTIDRPSAGLSTRIKLSERVRVSHEALLAVLEKEGIRKFEILSHSNGVVYALYTLLHLPDEFEVNRWFMTSPWVPSSISGSIALNLAGYVPGDLTGRLGSLVWGVQKAIGPLGVSMGFVRDWGTWSSGIINTGTGSTKESNTTQLRRKGTPLERIQHFESLQSLKPRDEETFGGSFYPNGMMDLGMKRVLEEGMEGMGEEARVCLRKGCEWGWVQEGEEGIRY